MIGRRHLSLFGSAAVTVLLVVLIAIASELIMPAPSERAFQVRLVFGLFSIFMLVAGLPRLIHRALASDE